MTAAKKITTELNDENNYRFQIHSFIFFDSSISCFFEAF